MHRFFVAASLLLLATGCFELDQHLTVRADGTASMHTDMAFTKGFAKIARKMAALDPEEGEPWGDWAAKRTLSDEERRDLEQRGVSVTEYRIEPDAAQPRVVIGVTTRDLAGLESMPNPLEEDDASGPVVRLERLADGTVKLTHVQLSSSTDTEADDAETDLGADDAVLTPQEEERQAKIAMKQLKLAMKLMEEAKNLQITSAVTVPGEIISVTPTNWAKVEGSTVAWTITADNMMSGMMTPQDEGFTVVFTPNETLADSLFATNTPPALSDQAVQKQAPDPGVPDESVDDQGVSREAAPADPSE